MAIIDRREIEFNGEAIGHALVAASQGAQGLGLPAISPSNILFVPDEGCIRLVYGRGSAARYIALPAEALGSLLVSFCVRSKLPMPRRADKSIRIERDCCVLAFRSRMEFSSGRGKAEPSGASPSDKEPVRSWSWVGAERPATPQAGPTG